MRIPPDAKVIRDSRLTVIRATKVLYERACGEGGFTDKVKSTMLDKGASFAESELAIARLQPGTTKGPIDARALHALVISGKLTIEQFLGCVSVRKEPLGQHLSKGEIDALSSTITDPTCSLVTEFKSAGFLSSAELAQQLIDYWPST